MTMLITKFAGRALGAVVCALLSGFHLPSVHAQVITESPEVVYIDTAAQPLLDKAAQLGTAVAMYEYLHNVTEYSPYHGSRSGSVNTLLGRRGSDVDIASTLIAMLRSQNIPARYAVGTVRIPAAQLNNWLGLGSLNVAVQVLKDQGIQGVVLAADRSTVDMEHTWVEAFVPFDQYRGINTVTPAIDCSQNTNFSRCTWVGLDASFKQKTYNGLNLDPYNALSFDYTAYYNAIKNNDATRRDKNPLSILEDQISVWLRANYPGKTLEDVVDAGKIVELREGLLPASLPFKVVGNIRRYDTVALHDASGSGVEPKKWGKTVQVALKFNSGGSGYQIQSAPVLLAQASTKSLALSTQYVQPGNVPNMVLQLSGTELLRLATGSVPGFVPTLYAPITISLSMDGRPGATSGDTDFTISADYSASIGGYYQIATGGESSNWTQVHRAASELLDDSDFYKYSYRPVFNPSEPGCSTDGVGCTVYEDANGNGWDSTDPKLIDNSLAMEILTGGLLQVSATQYYAKLREQIERADRLMKTKTPIIGFLGVASSFYGVEYVDSTAFSILPGGLLIDMKGITIGGPYRINDTAVNFSNRQFEFATHIGSSLEHEIWQELTGYDAVSTVRGIQMALANGATLLNPKKNATEDTLPGLYSSFGFNTTPPAGFTYVPFTIASTAPSTWTHTTSGSKFETFQSVVDLSTSELRRNTSTYMYSPTGGLYGWSKCVTDQTALFNSYPNGIYSGSTCSGAPFNTSKAGVLAIISSDWTNNIIPNILGQNAFDYFDRNKGFATTNRVYRAYPPASDAHDVSTIANLRNDLYFRDTSQYWAEYLIPTQRTAGSTYRFTVNIRKEYETSTNSLTSISMSIANNSGLSAGGGYVNTDSLPFVVVQPIDSAQQGK